MDSVCNDHAPVIVTRKSSNALIKETHRNPFEGIGKQEPLKHALSGDWSRRINDEHRFVFRVTDDSIHIAQLLPVSPSCVLEEGTSCFSPQRSKTKFSENLITFLEFSGERLIHTS